MLDLISDKYIELTRPSKHWTTLQRTVRGRSPLVYPVTVPEGTKLVVKSIWLENSDKSLKMTNVVAKKPSKSFLEDKVMEKTMSDQIEMASVGGGGGGGLDEKDDVFMTENLPTYAKSYILPRKMHRVESKEKVALI